MTGSLNILCSGHEEKGKDEVEEELNFSLDTPTLLVGGGEEGEGEEGEGGRKESETRTKPESRNKTMNATVLTFFLSFGAEDFTFFLSSEILQYFTVIPFAFQEAFPWFCLPKPHVHILVFSRINCHITVRKQT